MLWGQSIRAFYYAAFSVARAKDLDGLLVGDRSVHDKVWEQTRKGARRFFRDTLRPMRNKWDYNVAPLSDEPADEDLRIVATEGPQAFDVLLADARESVGRQHRYCAMPASLCSRCKDSQLESCARDTAIAELDRIKQGVAAYLSRIPSALERDENNGAG